MYAFYCFLLHKHITMHGLKNVKFGWDSDEAARCNAKE